MLVCLGPQILRIEASHMTAVAALWSKSLSRGLPPNSPPEPFCRRRTQKHLEGRGGDYAEERSLEGIVGAL
jgi:hypothetical protein